MTILTIINILTALFESFVAFTLFDAYMERRSNIQDYVYILAVVVSALGMYLSNSLFNATILNIAGMILIVFIASWLFKEKKRVRLILSVLNMAIAAITEIIVLYLLSYIKHTTAEHIIADTNLRIIGIIMSKALNFAIVKAICMRKNKAAAKLRTAYWGLFITNFVIALATIYLIFTIQQEGVGNNLSIACSIGLLCNVLITLYLYERISQQTEEIKQNELMEQQLSNQIKHMNELVLMQNQIRGIHHDLSNHMIALKALIEAKDYENVNNYIENLMAESNIQNGNIDTGNAVIDAIINTKRSIADKRDIDFYVRAQIPENIKIDPSDLCIILGNALDNALEACGKLSENKYIKIYL